jgi:putative oxidoreductase
MKTNENFASWGIALLRAVVGIVFLVHGGQKLFVFGIHGVAGMFTQFGIPAFLAPIVAFVEFVGGFALLLGIATRVAAALIAIDMLGAILLVHGKNGFFLPNGYEFALTLLAANVALVLTGAGALALDSLFFRRDEVPRDIGLRRAA